MGRRDGRGISRPFIASTSTSDPANPVRTKSGANGASGAKSGSSKAKRRADPTNAYTYVASLPKRHRTSAQTLSLSRDEAGPSTRRPRPQGQGRDGDGQGDEDDHDDMNTRIRKVAMMIAEDAPGTIESDESDVDSDQAWEDDGSDEERWGDVFRDLERGRGKKGKTQEMVKKPAIPLTVDLDESGDEEIGKMAKEANNKAVDEASVNDDDREQGGGGGGGDSNRAILDEELDDEIDEFTASPHKSGTSDHDSADEDEVVDDQGDEDESEDDDEDDEESDLELPSDVSDDESGPDAIDGLDTFISNLVAKDKKRKDDYNETRLDSEKVKRRRVLPVVSGPVVGSSDLGLRGNGKVDLASLIASHPSLSSSASALLPSSSKPTSSSILKQGILTAPLPTVVQDRLNREAAYEKTKEEGAKWATLMKRVKEAEHLSFPLQGGGDRGGVKSTGEMLATYKPDGEHESAVHKLLSMANLTETGVKQQEDEALQGQDLTLEEIEERRSQLRQQRELMFREETKAKRVAKIKSKTFRKLARKRAAKAAGNGDGHLDGGMDVDREMGEEEREKMERARAKERATLKHGARSGRWARDVGGGGGEHEDRRQAKEEMLEMKERLQRRIAGKADGSSDDDDDEDDGAEGDDEGRIKERAFDQLDKLKQANQGETETEGKGLMQMAFMRKAKEREKQKLLTVEEGVRRDIEMFGEDQDEDDEGGDGERGEGQVAMMRVDGNEGRMVFSGPSVTGDVLKPNIETDHAPAAQSQSQPHPTPAITSAPSTTTTTQISNPWLVDSATTSGPSRKRNIALGANSSSADKSTAALKKASIAASNRKQSNGQVDDDTVDIEVDGNALLKRVNGKDQASLEENGVEDGSGDERDELMPRGVKGVSGVKGFEQRDLVAEAFAGDNVVEDFAKEKQRVIDEDAPKVEDSSLAGWGSWGGKGIRRRKPDPKHLVTKPGIDPSLRHDAKQTNVIISEKKDKKAAAYNVTDLPWPYTSVVQYEQRFNMPLGSEWNARGVHQRETMPRVTKKPGAIIEPVRRMF